MEFCDTNKNKLLEMEEAKVCMVKYFTSEAEEHIKSIKAHVPKMVEKHWPRDDAGKPLKITEEQLAKYMEEESKK